MSDMTYICPADAAMKAHREGRITADEARDMVATPSTRTTCARCSWPLKVESLSDEDADSVEALHRDRCFAVGDSVRWKPDATSSWADGKLVSLDGDVAEVCFHGISKRWLAFAAAPFRGQVRKVSRRDLSRPDHVIRTPAGDITMRADPTLKPTEMRIMHSREHDDDEWVDDPSDLRPDGFAQSAVDAAKAVLLSKVERKR